MRWSKRRPGENYTRLHPDRAGSGVPVSLDAIEREIFAGRLKVGDPLPAETHFAEQFGVNRSTVREGIRLLEQSGLVERNGGKRPASQCRIIWSSPPPPAGRLMLHSVTFRELWEARWCSEPMIAERAARHSTRPAWRELAANIAEMDSGGRADRGRGNGRRRSASSGSTATFTKYWPDRRQSRARFGPRTGHVAVHSGGPDHPAAAERPIAACSMHIAYIFECLRAREPAARATGCASTWTISGAPTK